MEIPKTRVCKKCGNEKPLESFVKHKGCRFGFGHICVSCKRNDDKDYYLRDGKIQERKERCKEWRRDNIKRVIINRLRKRAIEKNMDFNLEESDITIPSVCPVLGIPLDIDAKTNSPNSISVDRIDNNKGYVKGNICVISRRANTIKNDANIDELKKILAYMEKVSETPAAAETGA